MHLRDYYARIANLPVPSPRQFEQFARHVAGAHGWYKCSLHGAELVVLLDPEAGAERLGNANQPALTSSDYVQRFGYLTYGWRHCPPYPFSGDDKGGREFEVPPEILKDCCGRLYPYVNYMPSRSAFLVGHLERALIELEQGNGDHPHRELLLACYRLVPKYLTLRAAVDRASSGAGSQSTADSKRAAGEWSYREADPAHVAANRQLDARAELHELESRLAELGAELDAVIKALRAHALEEITRALAGLQTHLHAAGLKPV